ncbi:MAG: hypothetical protein NTZ05_14930 [Chloroflexi bacterium]|nr:hypothetical protein [Chloroflexota bacterium]
MVEGVVMWRMCLLGATAVLIGCASSSSSGKSGAAASAPQAPPYQFSWEAPQPSAPAAAVVPAAAALPAAAPTPSTVAASLDGLWAKQDWDGVIRLLLAERESSQPALTPSVIKEKLYAAYINKGQRALKAGDLNMAREAFFAAITVDPSRIEAEDGFQAIGQAHDEQMAAVPATPPGDQAVPVKPIPVPVPAPGAGAAPKPALTPAAGAGAAPKP